MGVVGCGCLLRSFCFGLVGGSGGGFCLGWRVGVDIYVFLRIVFIRIGFECV